MIRVGIVLGSTRPGRLGEAVGRWVLEQARQRKDAEYELVDLKDYNLPLLDESVPASAGRYSHDHTKAWAQAVASFDAYVFVTPEYNHSMPASLKNALDYLYAEWNNKAAGFVSYGGGGGLRAVEQLREVMAELQLADVRAQVAFSIHTDFEGFRTFKPDPAKQKSLSAMLDQLVSWGTALRTVRAGTGA